MKTFYPLKNYSVFPLHTLKIYLCISTKKVNNQKSNNKKATIIKKVATVHCYRKNVTVLYHNTIGVTA